MSEAKSKTGKTRYGYRDGKLYYFDRLSVLVLAPWPKPQAWFKNSRVGWHSSRKRADKVFGPLLGAHEEEEYLPGYDDPSLQVWTGDPSQPDPIELEQYQKRWGLESVDPALILKLRQEVLKKREERRRLRKALRYLHRMQAKYFNAIPQEVRTELMRYPNRRWHLMCLFARCPGAMDLSRSNPALCYALASNWVFHKPAVKRPLAAARRLIGKKQRHILGWLGFPATESARRLLQKIDPGALDVLPLIEFKKFFADREAVKWLAHMDRIDTRILKIVTTRVFRPLLTGNLLREIHARPCDMPWNPEEVRMFWDVWGLMGRIPDMPAQGPFATFRRLEACHDELAEHDRQACQRRKDTGPRVKFPLPPFAGTEDIQPLKSEEELYREGTELGHCVGIYANRVRSGHSYIYRVLAPVRATMEIERDSSRRQWKKGQMRMRRNQPVNGELAKDLFNKVFASGPYVPVEGEESGEEGEGLAAIRAEDKLWEDMGQRYLFG